MLGSIAPMVRSGSILISAGCPAVRGPAAKADRIREGRTRRKVFISREVGIVSGEVRERIHAAASRGRDGPPGRPILRDSFAVRGAPGGRALPAIIFRRWA